MEQEVEEKVWREHWRDFARDHIRTVIGAGHSEHEAHCTLARSLWIAKLEAISKGLESD